MGLNIYFYDKDDNEIETESLRITHNLSTLVDKCGRLSGTPYYKIIWRPDELYDVQNGNVSVSVILDDLLKLLNDLLENEIVLKQYLPDNGFGTYEGLIKFVCKYIYLCYQNKDAYIYCCR